LSVEHTLGDLVQWYGERGATYFLQEELPYDANLRFGLDGHAGYRVGANVTSHHAVGLGIYDLFLGAAVSVPSAVVAPAALASNFSNLVTVHLHGNGSQRHVFNDQGEASGSQNKISYLCQPS
jgi:hypothetical protein